MRNKISDVSAVVGVSAQSIRLYEKHGIVELEKDAENGYRYFSRPELNNLIQARHLRGYGFNLPEISHLLNDAGPEDICPAYDAQLQVLEQSIIRQQAVLTFLTQQQRQIRQSIETVRQSRMLFLPGFYFLPYMKNDLLLRSAELLRALKDWTGCIPFVNRITVLDRGDVLTGYFVEEQYLSFLPAPPAPPAHYYPPVACLCTSFLQSNSPSTPLHDFFQDGLDYLHKHAFTPAESMFFRPLFLLKRNSENLLLGETWIPYTTN